MRNYTIDRPMVSAIIGTMLLIVFSYFIHDVFPLRAIAFVALLIVALMISFDRSEYKILGEMKDRRSLLIAILLSISGALLIVYSLRTEANMAIIPKTFGPFTIVAVAIGCTEELVFRGWVQSRFTGRWAWAGIVFAATGIARIYKPREQTPRTQYPPRPTGL